MKNKIMALAFVVGGSYFVAACSTSKSAAPSGKKSSKNEDCSSTTKDSKKAGLKTGFNLAESTYDDIKDIIEEECASCHAAGGTGKIDLSTYSKLKSKADDVIRVITSDDDDEVMPPSGKLSSSKIAKIQTWFDDGKKLGEEKEEQDDKDAEKSKSNTSKNTKSEDDCGDGEEDLEKDSEKDRKENGNSEAGGDKEEKKEVKKSDLDPELFKLYIEPPEMKACHTSGKTFLRAGTTTDPVDPTPRCDAVAHPGKFNCDKVGTLAAFKNHATVVAKLEEYLSKGYEFDQCGDAGGKPVVYLVCFKGADDKCVSKDKIAGTNLTIQTGSIGRP